MYTHAASRPLEGHSLFALARCVGILLCLLLIGTLGFKLVEPSWTFWRALYFTAITITTVGYGDEGLSEAGEPFAVVLVLFGIGTATYSLSQIVQFAVDNPQDRRRAMRREIARLSEHVVVCGFGRMGRSVCEQLTERGAAVVVVERPGDGHERAVEQGLLVVGGCATDDETLIRAGIERARGVVCCTDSDADNVFITLTVRRINAAAFVACRADAPESIPKMHDAGANVAISPHTRAGLELAQAIHHPGLSRMLEGTMGDSSFTIVEIPVDDASQLAGRTVAEIGQGVQTVSFVALQREGRTFARPSGSDRFETGDVLIAAGRRDELAQLAATGAV